MQRHVIHSFEEIISLENLLAAWQEFVRGKRQKVDVQIFGHHLMDNILELHQELMEGIYQHNGYESFHISDPKPRHIHKASVKDRLLHHAVYRVLYPFFDRTFITDSYSCRNGKGTHKALGRFRSMAYKVSKNNTQTCWVLKCDIQKFFASIDQEILLTILQRYIPDPQLMRLLRSIIGSFSTAPGRGLPLGNLTSQLFVNIYMNEFDQFMKHRVKATHYLRYADDFVILSHNRTLLEDTVPTIRTFLNEQLGLTLHPRKVSIDSFASGIDFLGWVHFPHHMVLRTTARRRMMKRAVEHSTPETLQSYLGLLRHGDTRKVQRQLLNAHWLAKEG